MNHPATILHQQLHQAGGSKPSMMRSVACSYQCSDHGRVRYILNLHITETNLQTGAAAAAAAVEMLSQ